MAIVISARTTGTTCIMSELLMDLCWFVFACIASFDGVCSFNFPLSHVAATGIQKIQCNEQFCDKETLEY